MELRPFANRGRVAALALILSSLATPDLAAGAPARHKASLLSVASSRPRASTLAQPSVPAVPISTELAQRYQSAIFKLVIAAKEPGSPSVDATAFVVDAEGLVATSFHAVALAALHPDRYELSLFARNQVFKGQIDNIDVASDLAFVRVPLHFEGVMPVPREDHPLTTNAPLYSLGFPSGQGYSVTEGSFNGKVLGRTGSIVVASLPERRGMSGAPVVDASGFLVGIDRAHAQQAVELSFLSDALALQRLFHAPGDGRGPSSATAGGQGAPTTATLPSWRGTMQDQLRQIEKGLGDAMDDAGALSMNIGPYRLGSFPAQARCAQEKPDANPALARTTVVTCRNFNLAMLDETHPAASLGGLFLFSPPADKGSQIYGQPWANELVRKLFPAAAREERAYTATDCSERSVLNHNGVKLRINYCVAALRQHDSLYTAVTKIAPFEGDVNQSLAILRFEGMSGDGIARLMDIYVNSIRGGSAR